MPTPEEFARYLVAEVKHKNGNWLQINDHWKAQVRESRKIFFKSKNYFYSRQAWSCPFCSLNFDVIGRLETSDEDTKYILEALELEVFF